jgi:hypothetical protein
MPATANGGRSGSNSMRKDSVMMDHVRLLSLFSTFKASSHDMSFPWSDALKPAFWMCGSFQKGGPFTIAVLNVSLLVNDG